MHAWLFVILFKNNVKSSKKLFFKFLFKSKIVKQQEKQIISIKILHTKLN